MWVCVYAIAMAAVESAVVVYLRALHPVDAPVAALLAVIPERLVAIEIGREAATIVMLLAVAVLAAEDPWERFLYFAITFGAWDLAYYGWLWVYIAWPPSPLTWDVLFLIPVPWLSPVLAPVLVSIGLVIGGSWLLASRRRLSRLAWGLAVAGVAVVLLSFTLDYHYVVERVEPPGYRWGLFTAGMALGVSALGFTRRA